MNRRRRWLPVTLPLGVALSAALAAGLVTYATASPRSDTAGRPAADAAAASQPAPPRIATPAPAGVLVETPSERIRPDAPLTGGTARVPAGLEPTRLTIPRIGVDTGLVRLGLAADGTAEVPTSAAVAGWYIGGPAPGQVGPAVLAGHVDSRTGPGVFFRLSALRSGDTFAVRRGDGRQVRFTVTAVERVAKAAFPTARVYGPTPFAEIRLVTCGGRFDTEQRHYQDNVVVFGRQLD